MTEVERITNEMEEWRQKRAGVTAALERATAHRAQLEAQRDGLLLPAKVEGDPAAQALLEESTSELATAEREQRDAGRMLEQIDATLTALEQAQHAAQMVELRARRDQLIDQVHERAGRTDAALNAFEAEYRGWYATLEQLQQLGDEHHELGIPVTAIVRWMRGLLVEILQWRLTLQGVRGLPRTLPEYRTTSVVATMRAGFAGHTALAGESQEPETADQTGAAA